MKYKTNPWSIVLAVVITAIVTGSGVYIWQTQNSMMAASEEQGEVTGLSLEGIIHYRIDGSAWLEIDDFERYDIQIQDTTILRGIPDSLLDERIKKTMKEAGQNYPWFGLVSSISSYITDGAVVQIQGTADKIIADEISVLK